MTWNNFSFASAPYAQMQSQVVTDDSGCALGSSHAPTPAQASRKKNKTKSKATVRVSPPVEPHGDLEHTPYNRKDKSLGLLSEHFVSVYSSLPSTSSIDDESSSTLVSIDQAAAHLGVERRRIYDIVNVLESLKIVSRKCKNTYYWHGTRDLMDTFADLQEQALFGIMDPSYKHSYSQESILSQSTLSSEHGQGSPGYGVDEAVKTGLVSSSKYLEGLQSVYYGTQANGRNMDSSSDGSSPTMPVKTKTLAKLSQRFVQYFLMGHHDVCLIDSSERILGAIPEMYSQDLDDADECIATDSQNANLRILKSKIRRLYDVANVLASLKIIEKKNTGNNFSSDESYRPSFKWCWELSPREILDRRISVKTQRNTAYASYL